MTTTRQERQADDSERVRVVVDMLRADARALRFSARTLPDDLREVVAWVISEQLAEADRALVTLDDGMAGSEIVARLVEAGDRIRAESLRRFHEAGVP